MKTAAVTYWHIYTFFWNHIMSAGPQRSSGPIFISWIKKIEAFRDGLTCRWSCSLIATVSTSLMLLLLLLQQPKYTCFPLKSLLQLVNVRDSVCFVAFFIFYLFKIFIPSIYFTYLFYPFIFLLLLYWWIVSRNLSSWNLSFLSFLFEFYDSTYIWIDTLIRNFMYDMHWQHI